MSLNTVKLLPPCSYQGGKQRLAVQICDIICNRESSDFIFYDLCCGSGAVSLEMLNRGYSVIMVDKGPYGAVWESIGNKEFNIDIFKREIEKLPDVSEIQGYLKELSNQPIDKNLFIYHYLLLQAGAFGSKQIWVKDGKWCNNTFRSYWLPTETSNRKSPVNPMMPMPGTLYDRICKIIIYSEKIKGYNIDIFDSIDIIKKDNRRKVIYIDPPYKNTTGYFETFDIFDILKELQGEIVYISEGYSFDNCESIILSEGRSKGNVNGVVKKQGVCEFLNILK